MKTVLNTILYLLMIAALILTAKQFIVGGHLLPKEKVYYTRQYDLNILKKQDLHNATDAVDFYIKIHDGKQNRNLSGIYSFDMKAVADLTSMQMSNDTTIVLPIPNTIIDQEDHNAPLITREKGDFSFNDEMQPVKMAMEKMAKHYSRTTFLEKSADALVEYASSLCPKYKYEYSGEFPELFILPIPHCGARIACFCDLCPSIVCFETSDSTYTRKGITFKSEDDKPLFKISYWRQYSLDLDEKIQDIQGFLDDYYINIIDPFDPKNKLIYAGKDKAIVNLGDVLFYVEFWNMNQTNHLPEVLYLLSCIQTDPETPYDKYYGYWIDCYDNYFKNINQGLFSDAATNLKGMASYQPYGISSQDEKYMGAVYGILTNAPEITKTGYQYYDSITEAYSDMFSSQGKRAIFKNKNKREELLDALAGCEKSEVIAKLENLFIREGNCDVEELEYYLNDIIDRGEDIDVKVIDNMRTELFLSYMLNSLHTSYNQASEHKYEKSQLREFFHEEPAYNNHNILMVKDCTKAEKEDYRDYKEILDKLFERGLTIDEDSPYFIYLFRENRGTFRAWDYDALVFSKDSLYHIPNYTGRLTGQAMSRNHYRDLQIGDTDKISLQNRSKFDIDNKAAVIMAKNMSKAHHFIQDINVYKNELKKSMADSFISIINSLVTTVPYSEQPITYRAK